MVQYRRPSCSSWTKSVGHPLVGLLWERQFEKILLMHGCEKVSNWECLFVHREKGLFLSVYVDDIKLAEEKQNINPMWKVPIKEVDLGEPTSSLDHVYLGCTQKQCERSKDIVDNYRTMSESRISAGATEKLPCSGTSWKTWYSMVNEQTCMIDHKMDQSMWQATISFDLLHSTYMWIQTVLLCGKHCQAMQIGTVSRLRFCRRSGGLKIYFGWNIVRFWKSYICSDKLDV